MSTEDPFKSTPDTPGYVPAPQQPVAPPLPPEPAYQVNTYGSSDTQGYPSPASHDYPAPTGFSQQPAYAQPAYPPPPQAGYGYGYPPVATTDGVSIAALVTSLVGFGPVAVVLGIIGINRTSGGQRKGRGMAIAGLIIGVVGTIVVGLLIWAGARVINELDDLESGVYENGDSYGDNAYLDGLWDQCEAGSDVACDDLYFESPSGSGYEAFGESCGGRGLPVDQFYCDPDRGLFD
ncbi:DUF4190 domain-containing protein [Demequina sp.]|uniref:DUF4190 domain-containing protein n=1 Tax=Demequina sp. TaxID=2050685 RepID=UPI003A89F08F